MVLWRSYVLERPKHSAKSSFKCRGGHNTAVIGWLRHGVWNRRGKIWSCLWLCTRIFYSNHCLFFLLRFHIKLPLSSLSLSLPPFLPPSLSFMLASLSLSVHPSIHRSIHRSIHPSIHPYVLSKVLSPCYFIIILSCHGTLPSLLK